MRIWLELQLDRVLTGSGSAGVVVDSRAWKFYVRIDATPRSHAFLPGLAPARSGLKRGRSTHATLECQLDSLSAPGMPDRCSLPRPGARLPSQPAARFDILQTCWPLVAWARRVIEAGHFLPYQRCTQQPACGSCSLEIAVLGFKNVRLLSRPDAFALHMRLTMQLPHCRDRSWKSSSTVLAGRTGPAS